MTSCDTKLLGYPYIFGQKYLMSVTDGIGQTPCSLEHYLVCYNIRTEASQICKVTRNPDKIQGRRFWCQAKAHSLCNFLLVINSNFQWRFQEKIFGRPGPSSFGRQQRVSEITTEPIVTQPVSIVQFFSKQVMQATVITFYTGLQNVLLYTGVGIKVSAQVLTRSHLNSFHRR